MDIIQIFETGGFIMWPLLLCSIAVWAVVVEKFWFLREFERQKLQIFSTAEKLIKEKKFNEAKGLCHNVQPIIGTPILAMFEKRDLEDNSWKERMRRRLSESQNGMKRYLWILGTIGSSAPFVGLFGTVVGIIKSFDSIATAGKSGFSVVATGLSEALVATAAGILVAVMAVVFFNFFQIKMNQAAIDFKNRVWDLTDYL